MSGSTKAREWNVEEVRTQANESLVHKSFETFSFFQQLPWPIQITAKMLSKGTDFTEFEIQDDGMSEYLYTYIKPEILKWLSCVGLPPVLWAYRRGNGGKLVSDRPKGIRRGGPIWVFAKDVARKKAREEQIQLLQVALLARAYVSLSQNLYRALRNGNSDNPTLSSLMIQAGVFHTAVVEHAVAYHGGITDLLRRREDKKLAGKELSKKGHAAKSEKKNARTETLLKLVTIAIGEGERVTASDWWAAHFQKEWPNSEKPWAVSTIVKNLPTIIQKAKSEISGT